MKNKVYAIWKSDECMVICRKSLMMQKEYSRGMDKHEINTDKELICEMTENKMYMKTKGKVEKHCKLILYMYERGSLMDEFAKMH